MKKKIYICMSILIVFILSLSIVRANTMDTYGMSVKEMEMMEEYKKGNINTDMNLLNCEKLRRMSMAY